MPFMGILECRWSKKCFILNLCCYDAESEPESNRHVLACSIAVCSVRVSLRTCAECGENFFLALRNMVTKIPTSRGEFLPDQTLVSAKKMLNVRRNHEHRGYHRKDTASWGAATLVA